MDSMRLGPCRIFVRRAAPEHEAAFRSLVHSERIEPNTLDHGNFMVAVRNGRVVGAARL
jgi:hypothetical protein